MALPRQPIQLAIPLPNNPQLTIHVHLTFFTTATTLFLTTTTDGESGASSPMGSFVCAMPNRLDSQDVLSTTFYSTEFTIDYAHRIAKILARRMNIPVYVGCSMKFPGLLVDEEMQSLTELIKVIMDEWGQHVQA